MTETAWQLLWFVAAFAFSAGTTIGIIVGHLEAGKEYRRQLEAQDQMFRDWMSRR